MMAASEAHEQTEVGSEVSNMKSHFPVVGTEFPVGPLILIDP
jgi:hypothetical protein